jgi:hypothetical protein
MKFALAGDMNDLDYLFYQRFSPEQAEAKVNFFFPVINLDKTLKIFESLKIKYFMICSVQFN